MAADASASAEAQAPLGLGVCWEMKRLFPNKRLGPDGNYLRYFRTAPQGRPAIKALACASQRISAIHAATAAPDSERGMTKTVICVGPPSKDTV